MSDKSKKVTVEESLAHETKDVSPEVAAMLERNRQVPKLSVEQQEALVQAVKDALAPLGDCMFVLCVSRPLNSNNESTACNDALLVDCTDGFRVADQTPLVSGVKKGLFDLLNRAILQL